MGRPSSFTQETADAICEQLMAGCSLRSICQADGMPSQPTVFKWLRDNDEFFKQYARAREIQAEVWADEINDIADDGSNDWYEAQNKDGSTYVALNSENIQRSRLRVDSRKWLLSKLLPKKYGDKIQQEVSGPGGGAIQNEFTVKFVDAAE